MMLKMSYFYDMSTLIDQTKGLLDTWSTGVLEGSIPLKVAPTDHLYEPGNKNQLLHPYPEIFMVTQGMNRFRFPSSRLNLHAGEMLLVPAGVPHAETFVDTDKPFHMLVLCINYRRQSFIHATNPKSITAMSQSMFSTQNPQAPVQLKLLSAIQTYLETDPDSSTGARCMAMLLKELAEQDLSTMSGWARKTQTLAEKATRLANIRFRKQECSVAYLAEALEVSPNHLSAVYRKETGQRLSDVIFQQRLQHAKDLLDYSNHKVVDIAAFSGFSDASPFIAKFKESQGMTPLQYRKAKGRR